MSTIAINTKTYTGPIDVLLKLVEDKKVKINQISLADITEDFLQILQNKEINMLEEMAEFLYVASVLVYIKSKTLLPFLSVEDEYETDAMLLEKRILFQKFLKQIAKKNIMKTYFGYILPVRRKQYPIKFSPPKFKKNLESLEQNICAFLKCIPQEKQQQNIKVENVIKLTDMIKTVRHHLDMLKSFSFLEIADLSSKKNTIVSFLAILELIKNGVCIATQNTKNIIDVQKI